MQKIKDYLPIVIRYLLFAAALTPLIYSDKTFYPYILGKTVFFRGLVEIALLLFLAYLISKAFYKEPLYFPKFSNLLKNPLVVFTALFLFSIILSTVFAVEKTPAFWGTLERGEGFWGLMHFFVFLVLAVSVFRRKDWLVFFKTSLIVGLVVIFYGFLQYFDVKEFPFSLEEASRPGSFIGNPSFLSAYLFLLIAVAFLVFGAERSIFWRMFSAGVVLSSVVVFFLSATRGALIGLFVGAIGLLFYYAIWGFHSLGASRAKIVRVFSVTALCLIIIFAAVFWLTRTASVWQQIPGLNRFSKIDTLVPQDSSTQTRLLAWQSGFEAFKTRPLFGWGVDNFLTAWDKYYNPKTAAFGETWLDRAHNKLIDLLVMQGLFGLIVYLGLYGTILYFLFSRKRFSIIAPVIGGILIMYFVQNLFLFDEINSYLLFFMIIGFLIAMDVKSKEEGEMAFGLQTNNIAEIKNSSAVKRTAFYVFGAGLGILIIYSLYFYNYIPYRQGRDIQFARGGQKDFVKTQLIRAFYPYNFVQSSIRAYITDFYYANQAHIFENDDFKMLSEAVLSAIDEIIASGSRDPRFYIRKNQILDVMAQRDPSLYVETEKIAREALKLAPNRHELWYALALSLAKQEKFDEALLLAKKTTELNPTVARTHFYLALLLSALDTQKNREEILGELDKIEMLDSALESLQPADVKKISEIYFNLQEYDRLAVFVMKKINGITPKVFEPQYYEFVLRYISFVIHSDFYSIPRTIKLLAIAAVVFLMDFP